MRFDSLSKKAFELEFIKTKAGIHTKFGGIPSVDKNFVWPTVNSLQYIFLMQYNCAELDEEFYKIGFPHEGLISIFIPCFESDLDEEVDPQLVKIFYFKDVSKLENFKSLTYDYRKKLVKPDEKDIFVYDQSKTDNSTDYILKMRLEMQKNNPNLKLKLSKVMERITKL